jgi:hypothetical protein
VGKMRHYKSRGLYLGGAFAKLRNAAVGFVLSVRPSARMEQLGSHWADLIFKFFLSKIWREN